MRILFSVLATCLLLLSRPAAAETFPERPISILVAWPAGGAIDVAARVIANEMGKTLKTPVVVINRPGAAGNIGAQAVAKAEPNGYTLLMTSAAIAVSAATGEQAGYDLFKDLKPITVVGEIQFVLVANQSVPADNVASLISYARQNPGKLNFGSTAPGTVLHLTGELFKQETAIDMLDVPFVAGVQAVQELIAGRLDVLFEVITNVRPHLQSGKVKMLGVASRDRLPAFKSVPTMAEAGVPGVVSSTWPALFAPAKVPKEVMDVLSRHAQRAMQSQEVASKLAALDIGPVANAPEQAASYIASEVQKWNAVAKKAKVGK